MSGKLARVRWRMGQALLPEHLVAQEEALLSDVVIRMQTSATPQYGFDSLAWNEGLLSQGALSLTSATLLLGNGLLLRLPDNAVARPVDLSRGGENRVAVHLHVMGQANSQPATGGGWGAAAPTTGGVDRVIYDIELSLEATRPGADASIKLGEFTRSVDSVWTVDEGYLPPLLRVGTSPFLRNRLRQLSGSLAAFAQRTVRQSAVGPVSRAAEAKDCLRSVLRTRRILSDLQGEIHLHPYHVLEALKDVYVDLCLFRGTNPDLEDRYQHENLGENFSNVLDRLDKELGSAEMPGGNYVAFEKQDGVYEGPLSANLRNASTVYLMVQKPSVTELIDLSDLKIASPSRLSMIHRRALRGITYRPSPPPPLADSFGPEVEFFRVISNEEWEAALHEGSVVFYAGPATEGLQFFLSWQ